MAARRRQPYDHRRDVWHSFVSSSSLSPSRLSTSSASAVSSSSLSVLLNRELHGEESETAFIDGDDAALSIYSLSSSEADSSFESLLESLEQGPLSSDPKSKSTDRRPSTLQSLPSKNETLAGGERARSIVGNTSRRSSNSLKNEKLPSSLGAVTAEVRNSADSSLGSFLDHEERRKPFENLQRKSRGQNVRRAAESMISRASSVSSSISRASSSSLSKKAEALISLSHRPSRSMISSASSASSSLSENSLNLEMPSKRTAVSRSFASSSSRSSISREVSKAQANNTFAGKGQSSSRGFESFQSHGNLSVKSTDRDNVLEAQERGNTHSQHTQRRNANLKRQSTVNSRSKDAEEEKVLSSNGGIRSHTAEKENTVPRVANHTIMNSRPVETKQGLSAATPSNNDSCSDKNEALWHSLSKEPSPPEEFFSLKAALESVRDLEEFETCWTVIPKDRQKVLLKWLINTLRTAQVDHYFRASRILIRLSERGPDNLRKFISRSMQKVLDETNFHEIRRTAIEVKWAAHMNIGLHSSKQSGTVSILLADNDGYGLHKGRNIGSLDKYFNLFPKLYTTPSATTERQRTNDPYHVSSAFSSLRV